MSHDELIFVGVIVAIVLVLGIGATAIGLSAISRLLDEMKKDPLEDIEYDGRPR